MMDASDVIRLVWAQTWQLSLLIIALAAAIRLTSRDRPYLAHALWLVVLLKCLTPPLWSSPGGIFCWLESRVAATAPVQPLTATRDFIRAAEHNLGDLQATPPVVAVWLADRGEQGHQGGTATAALSGQSAQQRGGAALWLLLAWLAGTSLALAIGWGRWWRCWRQLHRHRLPHDAAYDAALSGLARRLELRRPVRLMVTSSRFGPAVIGLVRPVIALPQIIVQGKSPEDLEPILAHELIHVRRGDLWVGLLQALSVGLWWFHPLVWLANRWISREAERCCDEAVLATLGCPPARYARCLLEVLERKQMLRPVPAFPGVRPVEVTSRRLERIMQLGQGCRQRMPWWCWIVMLGVASATLPGAAWVAGDDQAADAAPPLHFFAQPVVPEPVPPVLPQTKPAVAAPLGPLVTSQYELADVLARAREELGGRQNEARSQIAQELAAAGGSEWSKLGVDIARDENGRLQIEDDQRDHGRPELRWQGTTAIVRHDVPGHQRIAERIAELRRYGFARLHVEIQFITARSEVVEKAVSAWRVSPVEIHEADDVAAASAMPDPWDPWADGAEQRPGNRTISSIEQQCPFQYQVVDGEQFRRIRGVLEEDRKTNILIAPKITTFNGRSAMVQSGCQRPFVVGLRRGEPQIQIITEGITLRLKPELHAVGPVNQQEREVAAVAHEAEVPHARLAVQFVHSEVLDVTTRTINVAGRREPVTLQVPRVQSSSVESTLVAALGHTLIIGGLHAQSDDGTQALLVAITVRRLEPDSPRQVTPAGPDGETSSIGESELEGESLEKSRASEPRSTPPAADEDSVLVRVYDVADLVVPLPGPAVVRCSGDGRTGETQPKEESPAPASYAAPQPDFTALIDLIQSSIAPESWELAGGPGAIEPFPTNLSLIVRQTTEVHEAIADLLQGLRRLQEVQVAVETRVLGLSDADFAPFAIDEGGELASRGYRVLSDEETRSLIQSVQDRRQNAICFAPKITVFSGQAVTLQLGAPQSPYTLLLRPQSSEDRKSVQLRFAVSTADRPELHEDQRPLTIADGHTLFIDTQDQLQPEAFGLGSEIGTPVLSKLPYPNRLFKNRPELQISRMAVLVTPRIIIQREEEAVSK